MGANHSTRKASFDASGEGKFHWQSCVYPQKNPRNLKCDFGSSIPLTSDQNKNKTTWVCFDSCQNQGTSNFRGPIALSLISCLCNDYQSGPVTSIWSWYHILLLNIKILEASRMVVSDCHSSCVSTVTRSSGSPVLMKWCVDQLGVHLVFCLSAKYS